uniref:Uncharacterized protein n=1 Tax=Anopheles atroparvus TaxID=41427 RepID=A0AAG5DRQ6_ANOAO
MAFPSGASMAAVVCAKVVCRSCGVVRPWGVWNSRGALDRFVLVKCVPFAILHSFHELFLILQELKRNLKNDEI